jgi:hypothetical protein
MYIYVLIVAKYIYDIIREKKSFFFSMKKISDNKKKKDWEMIDESLLTFEKMGYSTHLHNLNNSLIGRR